MKVWMILGTLFCSALAQAHSPRREICLALFPGLQNLPGYQALLRDDPQMLELNSWNQNTSWNNKGEVFSDLHRSLAVLTESPHIEAYHKQVAYELANGLRSLGVQSNVIPHFSDLGSPGARHLDSYKVRVMPGRDKRGAPWLTRLATFLAEQPIPLSLDLHLLTSLLPELRDKSTLVSRVVYVDRTNKIVDMAMRFSLAFAEPSYQVEHELFHNENIQRRALGGEDALQAWPEARILNSTKLFPHEGGLDNFELEEIGAYLQSALAILSSVEAGQWHRLPEELRTPEAAKERSKLYAQRSRVCAERAYALYSDAKVRAHLGHSLLLPLASAGFNFVPGLRGSMIAIPREYLQADAPSQVRNELERSQIWINAYRDFLYANPRLWKD